MSTKKLQIVTPIVTSVNGQTGDVTLTNESKSLGLTSAAVGQIPKVKAVDSNGVPTEWESAALSGDMIYALDMVEGEGNTFTINNNFDDVVAAINEGKIIMYGGTCLLASCSPESGTVTTIGFYLVQGDGLIVLLTWNRGNSAATITERIFPTFGLEALSAPGAVYFDNNEGFTIKNAGAYIVKIDSNNVLVNDYTEFENAVKSGTPIIINYSDSYAVCTSYQYDNSSITCYQIVDSMLLGVKFDKSTKKQTNISLAKLDNTYFVYTDKYINVANDYDELDNAIKAGKLIVVNANGATFLCQSATRNESQITLVVQASLSMLMVFSVDKNTKKTTISVYYSPALDNISQSGFIYYDKGNDKFIIKDTASPIATTSTAGVIKVGNGLSISADGTLSVTTATYYTGTADPVNTLGADGDLYLQTGV
jgi:hypothetical protein